MSLLKNILLVMISPRVGWEEIDRCGYSHTRVQKGAFYPLLAVLALSCFVPMIYDSVDNNFTKSLMKAIIAVAMYLFTSFFASYLLSGFYPELAKTKVSLSRLNNYIIYNIIFLVIISIIINFLPGDFAPLFFLTLYVGYMANRGAQFLGLKPEKQTKFTVVSSIIFICCPLLISWLLNSIIIK